MAMRALSIKSVHIPNHRYLLNDACVLLGKPLVSGSALRFEGQVTAIVLDIKGFLQPITDDKRYYKPAAFAR